AYNSAMPAFARGAPNSPYNWSDDKIAAVLTYIRQDFGNQAPPITTEKIAEVHAKEGARAPYSAVDLMKLP
ncbi:MAG: hypothetical protein ABIZ49_11470, partial [Opitutaceae bacterium]